MNSNPPVEFTAAQVAAGVGYSKRRVLQLLVNVEPARTLIIRGNAASAWRAAQIPAELIQRLAGIATRRCFRPAPAVEMAAALLASPVALWQPPIPWRQVNEADQRKATQLREALLPALERQHDFNLSETEFETFGADCYRHTFGHLISARHWRRLFKRTIERDGGAEDWTRLEIFLPERLGAQPRPAADAATFTEFHELREVITSFKDTAKPTRAEVAYLWARAFELFEALVAEGQSEKYTRKRLLRFFFDVAPFMASTAESLRVTFALKLKRWQAGGRMPSAVEDQRPLKSGRFRGPEISQDDREKIEAKAVLETGGRVAQAFRELRRDGELSEALTDYYRSDTPKSYVPRRITDAVKFNVAMMDDIHHGPRQAKLNGAHIDRDWSNVFAADWFQSDDCTLPVYYYEPDGAGWFTLMRGQFLPMIDLRTTCILGYVLLSSRNYNSLAIRTLITKVCDSHGMPRKGFYFERGIWQSSKIITGGSGDKAPVSWVAAEKGLRDLGLQFVHSQLPRSKPIERVLGALQNQMERMPGYAGRNERDDRFERFQRLKLDVERRKVDPRGELLSRDEWDAQLQSVCEGYNTEAQEGKTLTGLSPEQAFEQLQNPSDPPVRFPAECRYLLSHHRQKVRVTANGVRVKCGVYRSADTGPLIGQEVFAWFNTETPEVICLTDLREENALAIPRAESVPAMDASDDQIAREMRRIHAHHAHALARYRILKTKFTPAFRRNLVDVETAALGVEMSRRESAVISEQRATQRTQSRVNTLARELGMVVSPDADTEALEILRNARRSVEAEKVAAVSEPTQSVNVAVAQTKKTYVLKAVAGGGASGPQRAYVDYLLGRLTEFRKAGQSFGQKFGGAISVPITAAIARKQLGCELHDPARFDNVCSHLKGKIDATVLGKRNLAKGVGNYHDYEAHE